MKSPRSLLKVMVVALSLIALLPLAELSAEKPTQTVTGIVKKNEVHREKVISVYIKDAEKGEFLVLRSTEIGKELLEHAGATVKATGYVKNARPDSGFTQMIDVLSYEIVPVSPVGT